jgi:hypothetical protein
VLNTLTSVSKKRNERSEEDYLVEHVLDPLHDAGLLGPIQLGSRGTQGDDDFNIYGAADLQDIKITGESKSTHNLPLPMTAVEVANTYNNARNQVDSLASR